MSKKQNKKFITPEILRGAVKGAFVKLNPRYMMRNPVMFVVEIGCFITLLLSKGVSMMEGRLTYYDRDRK